MPAGYLLDLPGDQTCVAGSSVQQACLSKGGAYWTSGAGQVCTIGPTFNFVPNVVACDTSNWSSQEIPPLTMDGAYALFQAVLMIVGLAYIFRLAILTVLNR